mgnify:FL=1
MKKQTDGLHHYHVRKRIHKKREQYPHSNRWKRYLDNIIYPVGILGPLMTLPQLWTVWSTKDVHGLSLFTWSAWIFVGIFWLLYGIAHKEKPIICSNIAWIVIELGVVVGILIYR